LHSKFLTGYIPELGANQKNSESESKNMNIALIEKVKIFCKLLVESSRCKNLPFHNWQHTEEVVQNSELIGKQEGLKENAIEELIIASYFHDIGYSNQAKGHEQLSCKYAKEFLQEEGVADSKITNVLNLIKVTEAGREPKTITQKIIIDADLAHLGRKNFKVKNAQLRKEWKNSNGSEFSNVEWTSLNITFMEEHSFYTASANSLFSTQKLKNIKALKDSIL